MTVLASSSARQEFDSSVAPDLELKLEAVLNGDVQQIIPCAGTNATVHVTITQTLVAENLGSVLSCSDLDPITLNETISILEAEKEGFPSPGTGVPLAATF